MSRLRAIAILLACLCGSLALKTYGAATNAGQAPANWPMRVVGYYPEWGMFNTPAYNVKNVITSGSAPLLSHLIYAFSDIENNACASYDAWADTMQPLPANLTVNGVADVESPGVLAGNFHQLQELKALSPNLKIMISIGGGAMDPRIFSAAASPQNRSAFVASCIAMYIKGQFAPGITQPGIFTGIDIDWEYPSSAEDGANYLALLQEFRNQLKALGPGYVLSTVGGTWWGQWDYMDPDATQNIVDFFNMSMYDFDGPWNKVTGFTSPVAQSAFDPSTTNNAESVVQSYLAMGVERSKIVFGMPFGGYHWSLVSATHAGLFEPGSPDQTPYPYWKIAGLAGYSQYRDAHSQEPWLYSATLQSFWTYDDPTSLAYKARYVAAEGLGGVMFWELSGDTPTGTLIKSVVGETVEPLKVLGAPRF